MTYERAVVLTSQHNYKQNPYTLRVIPTTMYFTGIPLIVGAIIVKEDIAKERFITIEEAILHGEKIMQNISSKA